MTACLSVGRIAQPVSHPAAPWHGLSSPTVLRPVPQRERRAPPTTRRKQPGRLLVRCVVVGLEIRPSARKWCRGARHALAAPAAHAASSRLRAYASACALWHRLRHRTAPHSSARGPHLHEAVCQRARSWARRRRHANATVGSVSTHAATQQGSARYLQQCCNVWHAIKRKKQRWHRISSSAVDVGTSEKSRWTRCDGAWYSSIKSAARCAEDERPRARAARPQSKRAKQQREQASRKEGRKEGASAEQGRNELVVQ